MSYLNFDKTLLVNLEKSLKKEIIRTNRSGAYNSTTIVDCNTRKYHGQLVLPLPNLDGGNHVLLSSFDETVIQHGAEFNLGIHKYHHNNFSPNGHKYIREFDCEVISRTVYRVGAVVIAKERLLVSHEARLLIKYTLLEAHSPIKLQFRPFLAFRNVNSLCSENNAINQDYQDVENGISTCLYNGYPSLYMQFSKKVEYIHVPDWYRGIEYLKEQERGYAYKEDLYVPGYFELSMKQGEEIVFSAGIEDISSRKLKPLWLQEFSKRTDRKDMFECLKNSATQFYKKENDDNFILAGYPWFKCRARDQFVSLPGATLAIGEFDYFEKVIQTAIPEIRAFIEQKDYVSKIQELDASDALLWFVWTIQQYAEFTSLQQAIEKYSDILTEIITFIRAQKHKNLFLHTNGLLFAEGGEVAATWMNAIEDGHPITPRTGYIVEINALWFNALKFTALIAREKAEEHTADLLDYQAEIARRSFLAKFWNGTYLNDYVIDTYKNQEVRPNMIFAVSLPFSPLDRQQQKAVIDICTKELLTPKGLRSLSPKSGSYRPLYIGGQLERDRNYHNGPVWPWTIGAFAEAYLKIYKNSGISFIERIMVGFEGAIRENCIGTIPELFDGNPPYKGHGAMSFAMNVSEILRVLTLLKNYDNK
jgi:predicted glycogen debranching enzyme